MKFLKTRDVKSPERGTSLSAGIDFFVPYYNNKFKQDLLNKNNAKELNYYIQDKIYEDLDSANIFYTLDNLLYEFTENGDYEIYDCAVINIVDRDNNNFVSDIQIFLPPNGDVMIPSGIHTLFDRPNQALAALNKSGRATKDKLIRGAELIDADYQGEIHCHLFNAGRKYSLINTGSKAIQFVLYDVNLDIPDEINKDEFYKLHKERSEERGSGGFGSTGLK